MIALHGQGVDSFHLFGQAWAAAVQEREESGSQTWRHLVLDSMANAYLRLEFPLKSSR